VFLTTILSLSGFSAAGRRAARPRGPAPRKPSLERLEPRCLCTGSGVSLDVSSGPPPPPGGACARSTPLALLIEKWVVWIDTQGRGRRRDGLDPTAAAVSLPAGLPALYAQADGQPRPPAPGSDAFFQTLGGLGAAPAALPGGWSPGPSALP
jgi:hypothetical protein